MFGFQSSSGAEVSSVVEELLKALADPKAAKDFLTSVNTKIAEFTKIREDVAAAQRDFEQKSVDANAALAEAKRLASLTEADRVSLDQARAVLDSRTSDVTARENALSATAAKISSDLKVQKAKFDSDRSEFENGRAVAIQEINDLKTSFNSKLVSANADIDQRLKDAEALKVKATKDANDASALKAKWEAKVASINALVQSVNS